MGFVLVSILLVVRHNLSLFLDFDFIDSATLVLLLVFHCLITHFLIIVKLLYFDLDFINIL